MGTKACLVFSLLFGCISLMAQNTMRVHYKDGRTLDISINQVDSLTFMEKTTPEEDVTLTGAWLWGNQGQGYYELLTINDDHTYTGYDNYFINGFDTMTYGWWTQIGAMITLQSNGFGYQRRYNWYITELTENALAVMTKMGPFTYYKLQPETLRLQIKGNPLGCDEDDSFIFADGVTATVQDNKLIGKKVGTTYVQKYVAERNAILAYKVIVE